MEKTSVPSSLKLLWEKGYFVSSRSVVEVEEAIGASFGIHVTRQAVNGALSRAKFLHRKSGANGAEFIQRHPPVGTIAALANTIPDRIRILLGKPFATNLAELEMNFGKSGNCSAFLLRKILEKALRLVIGKHKLEGNFQEPGGKFFGLEKMISVAAKTKIGLKNIIEQKLGDQIQGLKFLGDMAAHDPWIDVDMKIIEPQMPYYWIAIEKIAQNF